MKYVVVGYRWAAATLRLMLCGGLFLLVSCTSSPRSSYTYQDIPPITLSGNTLPAKQALGQINHQAILALDKELIDFVGKYVSESMPARQRAVMLHNVLRSPAHLGLSYNIEGSYTAMEAYEQAEANCMGFANLYIALARHYGLKAQYQMIERYPEWARINGMLSVNIHINPVVILPRGMALEIDISGRNSRWKDTPLLISDQAAQAQFYNNLAMQAYAENQLEQSYRLLVQAIYLDPSQAMLWSNLGALYKKNQQLAESETVYWYALGLNQDLFAALNNLAVLYFDTNRQDQYQVMNKRIKATQEKNPYYHFALAELSLENNDLKSARKHIQRAIYLKDDEPEFKVLLDKMNNQLKVSKAS